MTVRSLHFGFDVVDTDAAIGTLYYPADETTLDAARLTGMVAADETDAPWPIVVIMPGINVAADTYRWLAIALVEAGYCAVTYAAIGSLGPAGRGITPGIDMAALVPDVIGTRCSAPALGPLLAAIGALGEPVAGKVDFDRVIVGGHSAGGTVALHNTNPAWVPGLRATFSFAGHAMTSTSLGHAEASVTAVPAGVPILMLAGAHDGVIAASSDRYRSNDATHDPIRRTFDEAIDRDSGDSWLIELVDGNHFTICDPIDETSGRSFLEVDLRASDTAARQTLAAVIVAFVADALDGGAKLSALVESSAISNWARR